ncbi:MAG: FAD-binding protein [Saprospiraceae bacterium]|nr:FAD-binding protein [Saprospiraceae bacterium]
MSPAKIGDTDFIRTAALKKARINADKSVDVEIVRKSIDARGKPVYKIKVAIYAADEIRTEVPVWRDQYLPVGNAEKVYIVGAGPAGYFAALECLELGLCPIVLDRGKNVQDRRRDLRNIQQESIVNPDSNYCFGEGGAGTYSDGKLYTRSKKRGSVNKVLQILVEHGANPEILIDAHPHIGSNKLPKIIQSVRQTIEHFGGQVNFNRRVTDFICRGSELVGLEFKSGEKIETSQVILATGHSARDIYQIFVEHELRLEPKSFAIGLRIEHPQRLIDELQYGQNPRHPNLPASSYRLATEIEGLGVFSFCMCPGGLIVPASTAPGELVVNGMSLSRRDSPFANAGIVVSVNPEQWIKLGFSGPLGGLKFQKELEQKFFKASGSQAAPAQRVSDFLQKNKSRTLPATSYIPGLISVEIHQLLPSFIYNRLAQAIFFFDHKMPGFITSDAVLVGLESRTSSPVRIPRDAESLMHPQLSGLFPCGEGAGYAGGIVSAAIDGQLVAQAVNSKLKAEQ